MPRNANPPLDDGKESPITISQLARLFGISISHAERLAAEGTFVRIPGGAAGQYFLYASGLNYAKRLSAAAAGRASPDAADRSRLLKAKADAAEMDLARERGLTMPVAEVETRWANLLRYVQGGLLAIPKRLVGVDKRTMSEVEREIREALTELSAGRDYGGNSLGEGEDDGR